MMMVILVIASSVRLFTASSGFPSPSRQPPWTLQGTEEETKKKERIIIFERIG
jgi:hypothetical protein